MIYEDCAFCHSDHVAGRNHGICNLCNGYDENILIAHMPIILQVVQELRLLQWLQNFQRDANESWDDDNTNMGRLFQNPQIEALNFNGSNTECLVLRFQHEAHIQGRF
jgi:hypothetical protein